MTKTKNKKHSAARSQARQSGAHAWVWAVILILVLILIAVGVVIWRQSVQPAANPEIPETPTISTPSSQPATQPEATTPVDDGNNKPTQYEGSDPNQLSKLTGYFTRKGTSGDVLVVVTVIDQYLEKPGTCTLKLIDSTGTIVKNTTVAANSDVTTSVCETFEVDTLGLAKGKYTLEVQLTGDNKQGVITEEVTL